MLEWASDPAVGNILILLAAIVGVAGSFGLYLYRRRKDAETIRRGLLQELESMQYFDNMNSDSSPPRGSVVVTTTYTENSAKIGFLEGDEMDAVVSFYSNAQRLEELMKTYQRAEIEMQISEGRSRNLSDLNREVKMNLEFLAGLRLQAMNYLRKNLCMEYNNPSLYELPNEGELVSEDHPFVQNLGEMLVDDDKLELADSQEGLYRAKQDFSDFYDSEAEWFAAQTSAK